jgi:hypothetical protein
VEEAKQHGDAFDFYYAEGKNRSFVSVACHSGVSERTIARWSKAFNWQTRIIQRDVEINRKTEEKTNKAIVNTKADYRRDINLTLQPVKAAINTVIVINKETKKPEVKLKIDTAKDFSLMVNALDKLIKLDMQLVGEDVPDRTDLNIVLKLPEDWNVDEIM